jgi:serine/threonine protein kinase
MLLEGQQIGRYHFLHLLGSGGMGEVYLAEDDRIGQQIAIKVIKAELGPIPAEARTAKDAPRLFQREAKAIVKLDHPNILPLYDYGETQIGDVMLVYLVMPYRPEGSLAAWMRDQYADHPPAPVDVLAVIRQAADGLQHAHDRDIVHQDVKPSNFLLRKRPGAPNRPDVFLADFGIARFMSASSSASHTVRGTPTYMAPEQYRGEPVPATDQYALAVTAYELLTGRPMFLGSPVQMMYQHLNVAPPPPSTYNAALPQTVDAALLIALSKDPQERFGSVSAFANALENSIPRATVPLPDVLASGPRATGEVAVPQMPRARPEVVSGTDITRISDQGAIISADLPPVRTPQKPLLADPAIIDEVTVVTPVSPLL